MSRYPALGVIVFVLVAIGWLGIAVGFGYYLVYEGLVEPRLPNHSFAPQDVIELWTGLAVGVAGFFTLALGELLKVAVDIEGNTRATANALRTGGSDMHREPQF